MRINSQFYAAVDRSGEVLDTHEGHVMSEERGHAVWLLWTWAKIMGRKPEEFSIRKVKIAYTDGKGNDINGTT